MNKWLSTDPDDHYKKDEDGYIFEPLNKCLPPPYMPLPKAPKKKDRLPLNNEEENDE